MKTEQLTKTQLFSRIGELLDEAIPNRAHELKTIGQILILIGEALQRNPDQDVRNAIRALTVLYEPTS